MHTKHHTHEEAPATPPIRYCDRCARRESDLVLDELSMQELCPDCRRSLTRQRMRLVHSVKTKS